jgi:membrane protein required for colicin V production
MSTLVDLGLVVVVVLSLLAGVKNGLLDSVFSLASWVLGGLAACRASGPVLGRLPARFQALPGAQILTGVLLFLLTYFLVRMVGSLVTKSSKEGTGPLDRFLGTLFGLVRGIFLAAIVASFLVGYLPGDSRLLRGSRALPFLSPAGRLVAGIAPTTIRERMLRGWARLQAESASTPPGEVEA